ncbi:uncharacterized protein V6R79_001543 [Siganus canaliculatus]
MSSVMMSSVMMSQVSVDVTSPSRLHQSESGLIDRCSGSERSFIDPRQADEADFLILIMIMILILIQILILILILILIQILILILIPLTPAGASA